MLVAFILISIAMNLICLGLLVAFNQKGQKKKVAVSKRRLSAKARGRLKWLNDHMGGLQRILKHRKQDKMLERQLAWLRKEKDLIVFDNPVTESSC